MAADGMSMTGDAVSEIETMTKKEAISPDTPGLPIPRDGSYSLSGSEKPLAPLTLEDIFFLPESDEEEGDSTVPTSNSTLTASGTSPLSEYPHAADIHARDTCGNFNVFQLSPSAPPEPDPDPQQCLSNPTHDPFMGASCPMGRGERAKPFPWLASGAYAEAPDRKGYGARSKRDTKSQMGSNVLNQEDRGRKGRRTSTSNVPTQSMKTEPETKGRRGSGPSQVPASLQRFQHLLQQELPSSEMKDRIFNTNIGTVGNAARNQTTRTVPIIEYMENRLSRPLPSSFALNRESGEPGPVLDLEKGRRALKRYGSLPPAVISLLCDVRECREKYFIAWDRVLEKARGLCDLQAEKVQLWKEVFEMNAGSVNGSPQRWAHNSWRQDVNDQADKQANQEFKHYEAVLVECMKRYVRLKAVASKHIEKIDTLCEAWLQQQRKEGVSGSLCNEKPNNGEAFSGASTSFPGASEKQDAGENSRAACKRGK